MSSEIKLASCPWQGQTEAANELFRQAAAGADSISALLRQEPGSLQSPLHPAELHVDALLGHAQALAASHRCVCVEQGYFSYPLCAVELQVSAVRAL